MADHVLVSVEEAIARVTLNDPERLNAVDAPMLDAVADAVRRLGADPAVRVIALSGAGRGFCAGANLTGGVSGGGSTPTGSAADASTLDGPTVDGATLDAVGGTIRAIVDCPVPTVALVHGVAAGVGVSLALACDYVLASDAASFVLAFARIGLMPDGGATALVAASVGRARAMRMALTGEKVDGATAAEWGLVAEGVTADRFDERSTALLHQLGATAPEAARETSAAINAATLDLAGALGREERGQARLLQTADFREGVTAFFEKRPARFGTTRD
jgi:enoyl-CoA hydratase/carnithine racemase